MRKQANILNKIMTGILMVTICMCNFGAIECNSNVEASTMVSASEKSVIKLPEGLINYTSTDKQCRQILCEEKQGIYFLNDNVLYFFSLETNKAEQVYIFEKTVSSYEQNNKLYILGDNKYEVFDLLEQKITKTVSLVFEEEEMCATAIGADGLGRVYISTSFKASPEIYLYSEDGEVLSKCRIMYDIYCFTGFDSTNGNFYVEAYYNCLNWGYPGMPARTVKVGNVTDNTIKYNEDFIDALIDVNSAYPHQQNSALLGNKYLMINSTYYENMRINDAVECYYNTYMTIERKNNELYKEEPQQDLDSVGVRAVYNEQRDSIIAYSKDKKIAEYNPVTGEKINECDIEHYAFNLLKMDDELLIIEKDKDSYYLEKLSCGAIKNLNIVSEKDSMCVGEKQKLTIDAENNIAKNSFVWTSSDNTTLSVDEEGTVVAWKMGSAVISCISKDGNAKAECTIDVENKALVKGKTASTSVKGTISENIYGNIYSKWSNTVKSYLTENNDNTLTRVECVNGMGVIVEKYSAEYELTDKDVLEFELNIFGGFYSGTNYNYIVFGQGNAQESDECEVMRIVKFSKEWERLESASVYGADTTLPFHAGSLRMTEAEGKIFIHTCHQKYTNPNDGLKHQENMTFVLDENSMTISEIEEGHVSHSFNQFVQTDGKYLYRLDHGDAYPRAVYISRVDIEDTTRKTGIDSLRIYGEMGDNYTGVSIGGFELSKRSCLVVGNSVEQNWFSYNAYGQRNIFLTITDKGMDDSSIVWLTDYQESDCIAPGTPQMVKISDEQFLIMWEEQNTNTYEYTMRLVTVDCQGNLTSDIKKCNYHLSDCQPIITKDGMIKWYATDGKDAYIYELNYCDVSNGTNIEDIYEDSNSEENSGNTGSEDNNNSDNQTPEDDNNGSGDTTPGDDNNGSGDTTPGDDNNGSGDTTPGDDNNGSGDTTPGDDNNGNDGTTSGDDGNDSDYNGILKGDIDGNKKITLKDAQLALKMSLGIIKVENSEIADFDSDNKITLKDTLIVLKLALGIECTY